jgi:predicted metalloprotease with PDZ domain
VHVALGLSADSGFDWIVEGLAEYYSLELLQRGGAITPRRYKRALEKQAQWAAEASKLCGEKSTGPITALAVITFRDLDKEIRNRTDGKFSLDNVVTELATSRSHVSLQSLNDAVATILAGSSDTLRADLLPGCEL